jgi:predicted DNA repair protein MutK
MPGFLKALAVVGTVAMLWVGGGILVHGFAVLGWHAPEQLIHAVVHAVAAGLPVAVAAVGWITGAIVSGVFGMALGAALVPVVGKVLAPAWKTVRGDG